VGPDAEGADDADDADDFWDHAAHGCDGGDDGEGELLTQSGKAGDEPVCRRCGIPAGAFGEIVPCGPNGSAGLYHLRCWTDERTKGPLRKPPLGPPGR
jgi:hypothetical protein